MNRLGDQFFPGTRLSDNQRGRRDAGDRFDHGHDIPDWRADADEVLEGDSRGGGFIRSGLQENLRHPHGPMDTGRQVHRVVGFDDIIEGPVSHRIDDRLRCIYPAQDNDWDPSVQVLNTPQQLNAADSRQTDIGDDEVNGIFLKAFDRPFGSRIDDQRDVVVFMAGSSCSTVRKNRSTSPASSSTSRIVKLFCFVLAIRLVSGHICRLLEQGTPLRIPVVGGHEDCGGG